jgi:hypothetical protein
MSSDREKIIDLMRKTKMGIYQELMMNNPGYSFDNEVTDRVFNYVNNYYLLNKEDIPLNEYRTLLLRIRNRVIDFFERNKEHLYIYKDMSINDIMKEVLGEEEYERALSSMNINEEIIGDISENPREAIIIDELEEVDGGRRPKTITRKPKIIKRKRKTIKRTRKTIKRKRKTNKKYKK